MQVVHHDMWTYPADIRIVTTNSYINKLGELVMGRGAALEAKTRYPDLPKMAGKVIRHMSDYGVLYFPTLRIGLFQVKRHWRDDADLSLIHESAFWLHMFAQCVSGTIVLNYPGIGNGRLPEHEVEREIRDLPDNVIVCKHSG